ncbi:hypothetical protein ACFU96_21660 [Streptomyces sp. NPDC057620]|uniref:hypothetical protein n=1 Tax=Streptomyces sp. NPDC057620 TaxID=3346185 RepID=UPI0036CEC597
MSRHPGPTRAQHLAVRILGRTAHHLTTTNPTPMTDGQRTHALNTAMDHVLHDEPSKFRRSAARRLALMAMPPIAGTTAEYADRLRAVAEAPVCCGRPMRSSDGQYVCGNCGAWVDPGVSGRSLVGSEC